MNHKHTATLAGVVIAGALAFGACAPPKPPVTQPPPVTQYGVGLWRTAGPDGSASTCSWERDDKTGNPIGSGKGRAGPEYADIQPASAGDAAFTTSGCQPWVRSTGAPAFAPPIGTVIGDGVYLVGGEVEPGTWSTVAPSAPYTSCHWQRLRGFRGEAADIIQEGGINVATMTIAPTDVGVRVNDCNLTRISG